MICQFLLAFNLTIRNNRSTISIDIPLRGWVNELNIECGNRQICYGSPEVGEVYRSLDTPSTPATLTMIEWETGILQNAIKLAIDLSTLTFCKVGLTVNRNLKWTISGWVKSSGLKNSRCFLILCTVDLQTIQTKGIYHLLEHSKSF